MRKNKENIQNQQKTQTKYDRKKIARAKAQKAAKREKIAWKAVGAIACAAIIGGLGYLGYSQYQSYADATKNPYIAIGEHQLTKIEYDYFFNTSVSNFLNTNSYVLSYMGLDPSIPYDQQEYTEDMTWQDYFDQITIDQVKQEYALYDDLQAKGFTHDTTPDYEEFLTSLAESASAEHQSEAKYLKTLYGPYATLKNIKPLVDRSSLVAAYYEQILEDNTPTEEACQSYYDEHKTDYDLIDYYSFSLTGESTEEIIDSESEDPATADDETETEDTATADDETETEDTATVDDVAETEDTAIADGETETEDPATADDVVETDGSALADTDIVNLAIDPEVHNTILEMQDRLHAGESFEDLCLEYAPAEEKSLYEDAEQEYSLSTDASYYTMSYLYSDWLYDESRKAGDTFITQDPDTNTCYIVQFVKRTYAQDVLETISTELANEAVYNLIEELVGNKYEAVDLQGKINYLTPGSSDSSEDPSLPDEEAIFPEGEDVFSTEQ